MRSSARIPGNEVAVMNAASDVRGIEVVGSSFQGIAPQALPVRPQPWRNLFPALRDSLNYLSSRQHDRCTIVKGVEESFVLLRQADRTSFAFNGGLEQDVLAIPITGKKNVWDVGAQLREAVKFLQNLRLMAQTALGGFL